MSTICREFLQGVQIGVVITCTTIAIVLAWTVLQ